MRRGAFVTIAMQGDFGKPRPALVIQSNQFDQQATVTVLPVTSSLVEAPLLTIGYLVIRKKSLTTDLIFLPNGNSSSH